MTGGSPALRHPPEADDRGRGRTDLRGRRPDTLLQTAETGLRERIQHANLIWNHRLRDSTKRAAGEAGEEHAPGQQQEQSKHNDDDGDERRVPTHGLLSIGGWGGEVAGVMLG